MRLAKSLIQTALLGFFVTVPSSLLGQDVNLNVPAHRRDILFQKRKTKAENLEPEQVSRTEAWLRAYEEKPWFQKLTVKGYGGFRLLIGGLPPGSGFAFGGGYTTHPENTAYRFTFSTLYSTKDYRLVEARTDLPVKTRRNPFNTYVLARYSDFNSVNFFGLGPGASNDNRTTFAIEERRLGWGFSFSPNRFLDLDTSVSLLSAGISGGHEDQSLEERFDPASVPGFTDTPGFLVYSGQASLNLLDSDFPGAGVVLRVGAERFDDRDSEQFHFTRLTGEIQTHIPLGVRSRMLAFRARTSHSLSDSGQEVPFYLMEPLGGARSLRGFEEYRYRDDHNLLLNLEYRWEVWPYGMLAVFGDAGKVFSRPGDLDLSDLQGSYGIGIRIALPGGARFRIDLARSNEGVQLHIGSGPRF